MAKIIDEKYPITETDDLYDQNILTDRLCPKCGERIVISSDCIEFCSVCKWEEISSG